jgi:hypothetical protein
MSVCQADAYQFALWVHVSEVVRCYVITAKTTTASFFISCAKCLWDAVGHFLGPSIKPLQGLSFWHFGLLPEARGRANFARLE